jgi:hypothetical protein
MLIVNGLNSPIERHCLMNWIKKEDPKFVAYRKPISLIEIRIGLG